MQTDSLPTKRRGRGCLLGLGLFMVLVVGLLLAGAAYESLAEAADARDYPPPGQLVDVGGHRLHLHCRGSGGPIVVVDAGSGDWSTSWGLVQAEVAKTTRMCTYDRAGMGWSDPGPLPRDARQFAKELHSLLTEAQLPAPYVLVGHSQGGLTVRVFAHDYPADVAGVVLIDSMSPGQFRAAAVDTPARSGLDRLALWIPSALARVGALRVLAKLLGLVPAGSPDDKAYFARFVRPQYVQASLDEAEGMPASGAQAAAVTTFGELPLIVLSRGQDPEPAWQAMQAELLQLSSHREQRVAEASGHSVQIDQPQAAVAAIVSMVETLRQP